MDNLTGSLGMNYPEIPDSCLLGLTQPLHIFGAPYTPMRKESAAAKNCGALFADHVVCADCRRYGVLTPVDNVQK